MFIYPTPQTSAIRQYFRGFTQKNTIIFLKFYNTIYFNYNYLQYSNPILIDLLLHWFRAIDYNRPFVFTTGKQNK